jgi:outer membrane murein-binding lipoprotein Lpp
MEAVREKMHTQLNEIEEAQKHNAMINERYRKLQDAVADQFSNDTTMQREANVETFVEEAPLYISPSNVATLEQAPRVTEYVAPTAATLFTTQKFEAVNTYEATQVKPVEISAPVQAAETSTEVHYSLTPLAKIVIAAFTFVVVAMLSLICVNTQIIRQKKIQLKNLEEKKEQLMEQSEEIQRRIEAAKSEETIRQYAEANGWLVPEN